MKKILQSIANFSRLIYVQLIKILKNIFQSVANFLCFSYAKIIEFLTDCFVVLSTMLLRHFLTLRGKNINRMSKADFEKSLEFTISQAHYHNRSTIYTSRHASKAYLSNKNKEAILENFRQATDLTSASDEKTSKDQEKLAEIDIKSQTNQVSKEGHDTLIDKEDEVKQQEKTEAAAKKETNKTTKHRKSKKGNK